jgi:hypothetical protein
MLVHWRDHTMIECGVGCIAEGVAECDDIELEFMGAQGRVFIDDVELTRIHNGRYPWRPAFMAGQVDVLLLCGRGVEFNFRLWIAPSARKVDATDFAIMMAVIRAHRPALLVGESSARDAFGFSSDRFMSDLVRLSRLSTHGPGFVRAMRVMSAAARPAITQKAQSIPLTRARKVQAQALHDPRLAAIVAGRAGAESAARLAVMAQVIAPTLDTPLHRALKAQTLRVQSAVQYLLDKVEHGSLAGDPDDHALRKSRRLELLRELASEITAILRSEPLRSVRRAEVTAAALTQIAAFPPAAAAYRSGIKALELGLGDGQRDHMTIKPTWGIYETWCFADIFSRLAEAYGPWSGYRGSLKADESARLEVAPGWILELHFQVTFAALSDGRQRPEAWSVSRQRVPDIVLVLRGEGDARFGVFDAKYRRDRSNVLEAMESAHLYRDSLRIGRQRPDFCYLLLPAEADVAHLNDEACHAEHQVGTVCLFAPGGAGVDRCAAMITAWIDAITKG